MSPHQSASDRWATLLGLTFTASGAAHLLRPGAFEWVNRLAFTENIRTHVLINGVIETALGLLMLRPRTRLVAYPATAAYLTYFAASFSRRQRASPE